MMTIDELATALGLTHRQAYRRVTAARSLLAPYIKRGQKGALLMDASGLAILRRIEARRGERGSIKAAIATIREEMRGNRGASRGDLEETKSGRIEILERLVAELQDEVIYLRGQVDRLLPLALPRPRHRWLAWLRR